MLDWDYTALADAHVHRLPTRWHIDVIDVAQLEPPRAADHAGAGHLSIDLLAAASSSPRSSHRARGIGGVARTADLLEGALVERMEARRVSTTAPSIWRASGLVRSGSPTAARLSGEAILRPGGALFLAFNHRETSRTRLQAEIEVFLDTARSSCTPPDRDVDAKIRGAVIDGLSPFRVVFGGSRSAWPFTWPTARSCSARGLPRHSSGKPASASILAAVMPRSRRAARARRCQYPMRGVVAAGVRRAVLERNAGVSDVVASPTSPTAAARSPLVRLRLPRAAALRRLRWRVVDPDDAFVEAGEFFQQSGLAGRNLILVRDPYELNYQRGVAPHLGSPAALAA